MKAWISRGSGFVGGHLGDAFDDVPAPSHAEVDVTDAEAMRRSVASYKPDVTVHAAILNDFARLEREGWAAHVGATRNLVEAADDALVILVSTDWVFSGPARRDTPPNPVNLYGMLKAASELVVGERGAIARISAVQSLRGAPCSQDAAARLGVELPGVDEQLRRLERSLACTT